jgi:hypothetical protein
MDSTRCFVGYSIDCALFETGLELCLHHMPRTMFHSLQLKILKKYNKLQIKVNVKLKLSLCFSFS